jgi:hypothetical protein
MSATALLYGIQAAAGLGQGVYGYSQMQEAKKREALLRAQGMPEMQTPQEYFDMYQNASRSRQFEQEKAMTQSVLASNLAALQGGGSRALIGGAAAAQLTAQRGMAGAAERDFARQQAALGALAQAQARTEGMNFQARSNQYARDLMAAQAGYQAGAETMISGAETALGAGALMFKSLGKKKKPSVGTGKLEMVGVDEGDSTPFGNKGPVEKRIGFGVNAPTVPGPMNFGFDEGSGFGGIDFNQDGYVAPFDAASAFPFAPAPLVPNPKAQGGSVTTPGKYTADHSLEYDVKTKGGKTIATVTGDETLVFNPKQRRFLKKVIGKLMNGGTVSMNKNERKAAQETFKAFNR